MKLRLSTVVRLAGAVLLLAAVGGARLVQLRGLQSRQAAELAIASTDAPLGQPADAGLGIGPREEAPRVEWVRQDPASNARAGHATPQRGHGSGSGDAVAPEAEKPKVIPRPPPTKLEDISISTVPDASDAPIDIIEAQAESGARASGANTPSSASADTIGPAIPVASDTDAGSCLYPTLALAIKSGREMLLSRLPMIQATWLSEELCNVVVVAGELDGTAAGFGKSPLVDDSLRAEAKVDDGSETNEDRDDAVVASQYEQTVGSLVVLDVVTGTYAQPKDDDEEQKGIIGPRFHIRHKYRLGMAESEKSAPWEGASDWGMANKTEPELEEAAVRRRLMRRDEKHSRAPGYASRRIDPHSRPFSPAEKGKSEHEDTRTGGGTQSGWQADADKNLPGFVSLWNKFADSDWFLMIDDDTFLHLPTLDTQVLRNPRYNPEVPYFIGSAYSFSGCAYTVGGKTYDSGDFAQGGGGMLLSRGGMKKFLGVVGNCMEDLWECWAGDVRTAICMTIAGVPLIELDRHDVGAGGFWGTYAEDVAKWPFGRPCDPLITIHHVTDPQMLHRLHLAASKLPPKAQFTFAAAYPAVARVADHKMLVAEEGKIRKGAWRDGWEIMRTKVGAQFQGSLRNVTVLLGAGKKVDGSVVQDLTLTSPFNGTDGDRHALLCALACHQLCSANEECVSWTLDVSLKPTDMSAKRTCILAANLPIPQGPNGVPPAWPERWEWTEEEKAANTKLAKETWKDMATPWTGMIYKGLRRWLDLGETCATPRAR